MSYQDEFLTHEYEKLLIDEIDEQPWSNALSHRTQHYWHFYDYKSPSNVKVAPPPPPSVLRLANHLVRHGVFEKLPDQCLINEYKRGQGISSHSDHPIFGEPIVTISLLSEAVMTFRDKDKHYDVILRPRSIGIMREESRFPWKHKISSNATYIDNGVKKTKPQDYRRISVTFRSYKYNN